MQRVGLVAYTVLTAGRYLGDGQDAVHGGLQGVDALQSHTHSESVFILWEALVLQHKHKHTAFTSTHIYC